MFRRNWIRVIRGLTFFGTVHGYVNQKHSYRQRFDAHDHISPNLQIAMPESNESIENKNNDAIWIVRF